MLIGSPTPTGEGSLHGGQTSEKHPADQVKGTGSFPPRWALAAAASILVVLGVGGWIVCSGSDKPRDVVYCSGEDVSTTQHRSVVDFNKDPVHGESKAKLIDDFGGAKTADGQRREYLRRLASGECDVVYLDIVYTPEFASKKLLRDMTAYVDGRGGTEIFDDRMMRTTAWDGKRWGVPKQLDGGVLFYRTDTEAAPTSWQQVLERSTPRGDEKPGLRLQLDGYEGLTVVFLELAYAAGAQKIVSADGRTADVYQPQTIAALSFLRDALKRGALPETVTKLGDDGSLDVFSRGRARYLRAWPNVESRFLRLAADADRRGSPTAPSRYKTARNHGVATLPPWRAGGASVGILGGHNLVIPRSAKNPEGARRLVEFLTSREQVLKDAETASLPPVLTELRNDDRLSGNRAIAAVGDTQLELRPLLPQYARVSSEIYTTLRRVLRTNRSEAGLRQELRQLQMRVQRLL